MVNVVTVDFVSEDSSRALINRALEKLGSEELSEQEQAALDSYIQGDIPEEAVQLPW